MVGGKSDSKNTAETSNGEKIAGDIYSREHLQDTAKRFWVCIIVYLLRDRRI